MARDPRTHYTTWAVAGALALLLAVAAVSFARRDQPDLTPNQLRGDEAALRAPASLTRIRESLQQTDRAVAQGDWTEAEARARQAKERWLSYRTPMRAGGGRRMWSAAVVEEFERALNGMIADVAQRQAAPAREKIARMLEIIDMYDDQTAQRLDTRRDDAGDDEGETPRRAPGEAREN